MAVVPQGSQIRPAGDSQTKLRTNTTTVKSFGQVPQERLNRGFRQSGSGSSVQSGVQAQQRQADQLSFAETLAAQNRQILGGGSPGGTAGGDFASFLASVRKQNKKINKQVRKERNQVLGELDALEAEIGKDINVQVQGAISAENAHNVETVRRVQEQFAQLGRPVNPFVIGQLANRLAAGSNTRIQQLETDLRAGARSEKFAITGARTDIFQSTGRESLSDLELLQISQQFGQAGGGSGQHRVSGRRTPFGLGRPNCFKIPRRTGCVLLQAFRGGGNPSPQNSPHCRRLRLLHQLHR